MTVGAHHVALGPASRVAAGDEVEARDVLLDGVTHPAEVIHHKGIKEGRRYQIDGPFDGMPTRERRRMKRRSQERDWGGWRGP